MPEPMVSMTDRERIEALLNGAKPERVPLWPFGSGEFCAVHARCSIADAYNKPEKALATQRRTCEDFGWVFVPSLGYAAFGGWESGGEMKWPGGEFARAPIIIRAPCGDCQ
ncbi:MAG: hypothetical protein JRJ02_06395 [Deltaproteobacteria bacterium]|nr:hypothetical protein [Deltaproteobacteria bacterium]